MSHKLFCFCVCLLAFAGSYAQIADNPVNVTNRIIPPEPEAGNLGNYGNFKLNLSTGQMDINVPCLH